MKKTLLSILLLTTSLIANWEDRWTEGVSCCICHQWHEAEKHFTNAIEQLGNDNTHPHVWVDRARLYEILGRDLEALEDLNVAFASPYLKDYDYERAILTRWGVYLRLGMEEEAAKDLEIFKKIHPIPELEIYERKVVIRNLSDCECANDALKNYVARVFCDTPDDVIIKNGVCIAKRKNTECGCGKKAPKPDKTATCREWCDDGAKAGDFFCGTTFQSIPCRASCVVAVETIKKVCYWCCAGGNFYGDCVKPFGDIVGQMGGICDPAWD